VSNPDPNAQKETVTGALPVNRLDQAKVQTWGPLEVFAVHEPELLVDSQGRPASARSLGYDTENPNTGFVTIYVELNGIKVPIERRKAAGILADLETAAGQLVPAPPPPGDGSQPEPQTQPTDV
jgi:hypothetical protein